MRGLGFQKNNRAWGSNQQVYAVFQSKYQCFFVPYELCCHPINFAAVYYETKKKQVLTIDGGMSAIADHLRIETAAVGDAKVSCLSGDKLGRMASTDIRGEEIK